MNQLVRICFYFLIMAGLLEGCQAPDTSERALKDLIEIDKEFSRKSLDLGAHTAFIAYIDDSCVLLRPNRYPVIGRKNIEELFSKPDTSFSLTWEPVFADVSQSGDLGYTYGIYTVQMDSPEGQKVTKEGTYVTIWKKGKDGKWKFVLDTGNQGLGSKNPESQ